MRTELVACGEQGPRADKSTERAQGSHRWKVALLVLLAACAASAPLPPAGAPLPTVGNGATLALRDVWSLERLGPSPADTTVRFAVASGRTIVIRHPRPDHAIFAVVTIPPLTMQAVAGDSATVHLRPLPGRYGLTLSTEDRLTGIAIGAFFYAVHFAAPDDAKPRYPTPTRFEAAMAAARLLDSTSLRFLPSERPAGDMVRFAMATPGTYFLAAPR